MCVGIVALFEIDSEEIFLVNTDLMDNNKIQRDYAETIKDAVDSGEIEITVNPKYILSLGAYNSMRTSIAALPCILNHTLIVREE
jgi:hypothetical protein